MDTTPNGHESREEPEASEFEPVCTRPGSHLVAARDFGRALNCRQTVQADQGAGPEMERNDLDLVSHSEWKPALMPGLADASQQETIEGLVQIIGVEGPILAERAYQLYAKSSGASRVGSKMRSALDQAVIAGVRSGAISQLSDLQTDQLKKTLYLPGSEPVVLRTRGSRDLDEIPLSELQLLLDALGPRSSFEEKKRSALEALNRTQMTLAASKYLDECLHYTWAPSVGPADPSRWAD